MLNTKKHMSRRTVLRGMGVTLGLPLLDAMIPAHTALAKTAAGKVRLAAIEMVSYTSGPYLGNAEAGLIASAFSLRASVVSGGLLCVLGALSLAWALPGFRRYDSREGIARKEVEEAGLVG